MKLTEVALEACSMAETLAARSLATDRARSFSPICHKEIAYICKPCASSRPRRVNTVYNVLEK